MVMPPDPGNPKYPPDDREHLYPEEMRRPKVVAASFGQKAPDNLAADLRKIADAVDRGEITAMVAAFVEKGEYSFHYAASISSGLELATLLQHRCLERYKG